MLVLIALKSSLILFVYGLFDQIQPDSMIQCFGVAYIFCFPFCKRKNILKDSENKKDVSPVFYL